MTATDRTPGTPIDRAKLLSVGYIGQRSRPHVREGRRDDGIRFKATTDEAGNTVTEHAVKGDRQDVHIRNPTIVRSARVTIPPTTREPQRG